MTDEPAIPEQLRRQIWTPANAVTALRVPLGLMFPFFNGQPRWELAILLAAAFSDFIDGQLARRMGQAGGFGALLDPICDKFFLLILALTYAWDGRIPLWMLAIVLLRDAYMLLFSSGLLLTGHWHRVHVTARLAGKAVTVLQLLFFGLGALLPLLRPTASPDLATDPMILAMLASLGLLSLLACIDYTRETLGQLA